MPPLVLYSLNTPPELSDAVTRAVAFPEKQRERERERERERGAWHIPANLSDLYIIPREEHRRWGGGREVSVPCHSFLPWYRSQLHSHLNITLIYPRLGPSLNLLGQRLEDKVRYSRVPLVPGSDVDRRSQVFHKLPLMKIRINRPGGFLTRCLIKYLGYTRWMDREPLSRCSRNPRVRKYHLLPAYQRGRVRPR